MPKNPEPSKQKLTATQFVEKNLSASDIKSTTPQSQKKLMIGCLIALAVFLLIAIIATIGSYFWVKKKAKEYTTTLPSSGSISPLNQTSEQENQNLETEPITQEYVNNEFGFKLKLTPSWKDYKAKKIFSDGGYTLGVIRFYLPTSDPDYANGDTSGIPGHLDLFSIAVYDMTGWKAHQADCQSGMMCVDREVGRNNRYVFAFFHFNGIAPADIPLQAVNDMETIANNMEPFDVAGGTNAPSYQENQGDYSYNDNFAANSAYFYNCNLNFAINYPGSWTVEDNSSSVRQVYFYGPNVTVKFESIAVVSGETLADVANRRGNVSTGNFVLSQPVDLNGTQAYENDFTYPNSRSYYWLHGGRAIELMFFGDGYDMNYTTMEQMMTTLKTTGISECGGSSTQKTSSGFDCSTWIHPNGDIGYWWYEISQEERDCYVSRFGDPGLQ